jgi:hypothetical protein
MQGIHQDNLVPKHRMTRDCKHTGVSPEKKKNQTYYLPPQLRVGLQSR